MNKIREFLEGFRDMVFELFDIHGGEAVGLLTLALAWAMFKGHDIGAGSAAAYATAVGAFATTNIMRPKQ